MNIFKHLFKKNLDYAIATYNSLVETPKREDFSMEDGIIIDEWKDYFLQILSQNITLTSKSLHDENYQDELDMNLDLLMKISFDYESEVLTLEEKRTRSLITYAKLGLYLNKIIELEKEIKFKIIALMELQEGLLNNIKVRYIINRRNCIRDEVNNLLGILCIFKNQKSAIYNKVNACSLEYKTIVNGNEEIVDNEYLCDRYQKLMEYADVLLTGIKIEDVESFNEIVNKIASLERYFEMYVYLHSKDIDDMRRELENGAYYVREKSLIHQKPEKINLEKLKELEIKFRVFDEFGLNIVTTEDLYNLYKLKFDYTVIDIYNYSDNRFLSANDERDFLEYSIYGQIIIEMIERIITDEKHVLTYQFDTKDKFFWTTFNAFFTSYDDVKFDVDYILTNNLVLSFLLAINNFDLEGFFSKKRINKPLYIHQFESEDISFEENIPLKTFCMVYWARTNVTKRNVESKALFTIMASAGVNQIYLSPNLELLAWLFDMKKEYWIVPKSQKDHIYVPEGIVRMLNHEAKFDVSAIVRELIKKVSYYRVIHMPSSLRVLNTRTFCGMEIKQLFLNEGLDRFINGGDFMRKIKVKELFIPSTMLPNNNLFLDFDMKYLEAIHFQNIIDSKSLHDKVFIRHLLKSIISIWEIKGKRVLKCNTHIYLWVEEYYGVNSNLGLHFRGCDIENMIEKIAKSYGNIYKEALRRGTIFTSGEFMNLLTNEFIKQVNKYCKMSIDTYDTIKVLKKKLS